MTELAILRTGSEGLLAGARARLNVAATRHASRNMDVDADGRTFVRLMALMLPLAAARAAYSLSTGVDTGEAVPWASWTMGAAFLASCTLARRRGLAEAALALRAGGLLALTKPLFASFCVVVFATGRANPLRDGAFESADRWLGLDWLTYARLIDTHDWLWRCTALAYGSIMPQFLVVIFAMVFARQASRLYAYLLAQTLALTAVALVALWLPSIGAYAQADGTHAHFLHTFLTGDSMTASIEWLRRGGVGNTGVDCMTLISFPSFHACCCVLFAWSTWRIAGLRWIMLALDLTMAAATPVHGSHYFVDVIAGATIAAIAIFASSWIVSLLSAHAAQDSSRGSELGKEVMEDTDVAE